jgi:hypothetical protein
MAVNSPEVQVLWDNAFQTSVKVTGYYNAATGGFGTPVNNLLVNPKTLAFANTQQTCLVSLSGVEFAVGANGYVQLAWEGASANTVVYTIGKTQAGTLNGTVPNNATSPTGNLVLTQNGLMPLDSYSMVLTLSKVQGFANGMYAYSKDGGAA